MIKVGFNHQDNFACYAEGYTSWSGTRLGADDITAVFAGLEKNDLVHYTHILTGRLFVLIHSNSAISSLCRLRELGCTASGSPGHCQTSKRGGEPAPIFCFHSFDDLFDKINPNISYVCDPVLGDDDKLYVPAGSWIAEHIPSHYTASSVHQSNRILLQPVTFVLRADFNLP